MKQMIIELECEYCGLVEEIIVRDFQIKNISVLCPSCNKMMTMFQYEE